MKILTTVSSTPSTMVLLSLLLLTSACNSSSNDVVAEPNSGPVDDVPIPAQPDDPAPSPNEPSPPPEPVDTPEPADTPEPSDTPVTSETPLLIPPVDENSNLGRLLDGIYRQVEATFVDLNQRLRSGVLLTEQQNQCLGSFDPAFGESLTMIACEQPLATNDIALYVERASFYNTEACQSSLFNGETNHCVVSQARITVPTTFIIPDNGGDGTAPERPQPLAGAEIYYAINDTQLRLENNPSMLTGVFRCHYSLESGLPSGDGVTTNCDNVISAIADRFDALISR